jgi:hypothetical protein
MTDASKPRPMPVRPARGPTPARGTAAETPMEPSSEVRRWMAPDGRSWEVRIEGRGRTGRGTDPAAVLALLVFRPVDAGERKEEGPDASGGALEVLAVVEALADVSDLVLGECFAATKPFRPLPPPSRDPSPPRRRPHRG